MKQVKKSKNPKVDLTKLRFMYVSQKKSTRTIAKEWGCNQKTVRRWLKRLGIPIRSPSQKRHLEGQRFGKLLVLRRAPTVHKIDRWLTLCDCGREYITLGMNLVKRKTVQCFDCTCPSIWLMGVPHRIWTEVLGNAKQRNMGLNVTFEEIALLYHEQGGMCALSGVAIGFAKTNSAHRMRKKTTASLDRIDSSKGYVKGNIQWVHKNVNFMKQRFSQEEFIEWCKLIARKNDTHSHSL